MQKLFYGEHLLATVIRDPLFSGLFRIQFNQGAISDLANLTRAKDAAETVIERGPPPRDRRHLRWQAPEGPLKARRQARRAIGGRR
jgi:hypothetical protein